MLQITATELKSNFGKYLSHVTIEDIIITKNGVQIAILTAPKESSSIVDKMTGLIPNDGYTLDDARKERLEYDKNID